MPATFNTVGCKLTVELIARVDGEVRRRMATGAQLQGDVGAANRSSVIRDALREYLDRRELVA